MKTIKINDYRDGLRKHRGRVIFTVTFALMALVFGLLAVIPSTNWYQNLVVVVNHRDYFSSEINKIREVEELKGQEGVKELIQVRAKAEEVGKALGQ